MRVLALVFRWVPRLRVSLTALRVVFTKLYFPASVQHPYTMHRHPLTLQLRPQVAVELVRLKFHGPQHRITSGNVDTSGRPGITVEQVGRANLCRQCIPTHTTAQQRKAGVNSKPASTHTFPPPPPTTTPHNNDIYTTTHHTTPPQSTHQARHTEVLPFQVPLQPMCCHSTCLAACHGTVQHNEKDRISEKKGRTTTQRNPRPIPITAGRRQHAANQRTERNEPAVWTFEWRRACDRGGTRLQHLARRVL